MNFNTLKGRIAEALVESIFHRACYRVARLGRESDVQRLLKEGEDDSPDFLVWKPVEQTPGAFWLFNIEVKYRSDPNDFLRFGGAEKLVKLKEQWPKLYFVLVTDHPDAGRSCFQAMCLSDYAPGGWPTLPDLHCLPALGIWQGIVEEHEKVAKRLFHELVPDKVREMRQQQDEMNRWAAAHLPSR